MAQAAEPEPDVRKRVLLLNSYHPGLRWTRDVTRGVRSVLETPGGDHQIHVEYMDTKHFQLGRYEDSFLQFLKSKYAPREPDVVIASDDNAFQFVLRHRSELFPDTPLVFCGVNYLEQWDGTQHESVTGVTESFDIYQSLEVALELHPHTHRLLVINDRTTTGLANERVLARIIPEFTDRVDFVFLRDMTMKRLQSRLEQLGPGDVVLLMSFTRDAAGQTFTYRESVQKIAAHCPVPIYGFWDFYLGRGIVGGMITDGFSQGKAAAKKALRILQGESPSNIPIMRKSPNRYMFDHEQLVRFGIDPSLLPPSAALINAPGPSFYEENPALVWGVVFTMTALLLLTISLVLNVVRRKAAEKGLQKYHAELEELVEKRTAALQNVNEKLTDEVQRRRQMDHDLQSTLDNLQRTNEQLQQFVYVASHDLQEPLRKIQAFGNLLDRRCTDALGEEERDYLHRMESAAGRMQQLINDLLKYSRIATRGDSFRSVDLDKTTEEVVADFQDRIDRLDATVETGPMPEAEADPQQIRLLLRNLLDNALKFRKEDEPPHVEIKAKVTEEENGEKFCHITVSDNGIGFDEKYRDRIFDVFQKLHPREAYKGTGVGLSLCQRIARRHGGHISAESTPGEGTSFTVTIPLRQQKHDRGEKQAPAS